MANTKILVGNALDVLRTLPSESVDCCVTSPPYWGLRAYKTEPMIWGGDSDCEHVWGDMLDNPKKDTRTAEQKIAQGATVGANRSYNEENISTDCGCFCQKCGAWKGELGLEPTPQLYIQHLIAIFDEVKRVLKKTGTCWVNLGDTYSATRSYQVDGTKQVKGSQASKGMNAKGIGIPEKSLVQIPSRFAIAMTDELGFILRNSLIWEKPNAMPQSCRDRFTVDFENVFFFTKSKKYYFEQQFEPLANASIGRAKRKEKLIERTGMGTLGKQVSDGVDTDHAYAGLAMGRNGKTGYNLEKGRNMRCVWNISTKPFKGSHFACVDQETEILTKVGWKRHDTVSLDDEIATMNILDETIHYHKPYGIYKYPYDGKMVSIENQWISQVVTPNHRLLVKTIHSTVDRRVDDTWHYVIADKLKPYSGVLFPNSGAYNGEFSIGLSKAKLLGWIISEGHILKNGSIQIYQSNSANPEKVETIRQLLTDAGQVFSERHRHRTYPSTGKECEEVVFALNKTRNDNDWIFEWISHDNLPSWKVLHLRNDELEGLFDALIDGDGYRREDGRVSFIQKNPYTQDWFRTLCVHLNKRTTLHKLTRISSCLTTHVTNFNYSQVHQTDFKECVSTIDYTGIVWCPNLPNSNFICKRNGKISITGNTFPPELPERCIKAGSSEFGCCAACGKPYAHKIERKSDYTVRGEAHVPNADTTKVSSTGWSNPTYIDEGWEPTCKCGCDAIVPSVVLDPFGGSGTTAMVANGIGRDAIVIELNPDYVPLIEKRLKENIQVLV